MAKYIEVTDVQVVDGDMTVSASTTNTDYPGITLTFTTKYRAGSLLVYIKQDLERAANMIWTGYSNPSWEIVEE